MKREKNKTLLTLFIWFLIFSYMGAIFFFSNMSYPPQPLGDAKEIPIFEHFVEYFILGALLVAGFARLEKTKRHALLLAIFVGALYGISDEIHQSFVPGRDMSALDVLVDSLGVVAGVFLVRGKKR